ncbi:MAG: hypothetical protein HC915_00825 [Anaerolineae bacterium]|nr:hypothetical protein [Anaerolineae bacterium]
MAEHVKVTLQDGMHFVGTTPSGDWLIPLDADVAVGGQELGHRPLHMLLVGLAGCTAMDVVSICAKTPGL